jgi:hypothetical protein
MAGGNLTNAKQLLSKVQGRGERREGGGGGVPIGDGRSFSI